MPQYLSPGVYVEDVPPSARPIAGVGTSTAGFIGIVEDGPTIAAAGSPQLITSWEEFKTQFGDISLKNKILALSVYGFFNNGGTRCWVMRVAVEADLGSLANELEKFEVIDEIAIVAVPGVTNKAQQDEIVTHCANMKDRFAILDGIQTPADLTSNGICAATDSPFAALYFPWIKVVDPTNPSVLVTLPPSGHIAGVYARVDGERGVFKAPANEVIRGAVDLERKVSKSQQDGLNGDGVNIIRDFGGNFKIWGARTLGGSANNEFMYISTRRLMNFLQESIDEGTQWVVFEPNSPALWQRITRTVEDFLLTQWQAGALFGETPKQAFYVKCDKDTNPPNLREIGQVVTEIGVAIVKPAEFVIFRIQQMSGK